MEKNIDEMTREEMLEERERLMLGIARRNKQTEWFLISMMVLMGGGLVLKIIEFIIK